MEAGYCLSLNINAMRVISVKSVLKHTRMTIHGPSEVY